MGKGKTGKRIVAVCCCVFMALQSIHVYEAGDTPAEEVQIEKKVIFDYEAVSEGETLDYELQGYTEEDVLSTKWYSGDVLKKESEGVCSYTVQADDEEKFISLEVVLKDNAAYFGKVYYSELPVLYIDSESSYDSFQVKTEEYTETSIQLVSDDYTESQLYSGQAGLRLRGNSTSGLAKKPFKLKLDSKADLLGMGKNKHWVLLANAIDVTNMRNKLLYDFSGDIGAQTYMQSENVVMIYNGEYMGVYQLCEQVRIGDNRVEIYNWEDTAEDVADVFLKALQQEGLLTKDERKAITSDVEDELKADYGWLGETHEFSSETLKNMNIGLDGSIDLSDYVDFDSLDIPDATGGALVEMDFYEGDNAELLTAYRQPYYFDTPENGETFTELYDFMKEYIQSVEYALHDTDFTFDNTDVHYINTDKGYYDWGRGTRVNTMYARNTAFLSKYTGMHYSELLDMDSAVVNFLVCEFSRNWDSMKNSAFMYKDIDGKLIMGPAWDFDWAWGNGMYNIYTDIPTGWQTTDEYFANEQYYQTVQWNRYLVRDPYFLERVYEKYHEIRGTVIEDIIKDGGLIDTYYDTYKNASYANDEKWGGSMGNGNGAGYDEETAKMKAFILNRVEWLDAQFTSVEQLRQSIGYYETSDKIQMEQIDTESSEGNTVITATVSDSQIKQVSFQVNGTYMKTVAVTNGKAVLEVPDSALTDKLTQANVVQVRAVDGSGNYINQNAGVKEGEYVDAISNYAVFEKEIKLTLKDSSAYEITDDSMITYAAEGTTVEEIAANFANKSVAVQDLNGNEYMDGNASVGTGWKVLLKNGDYVTDEAYIIVPGDVNGSGDINVYDMEDVQKELLGISHISDVAKKAAMGLCGSESLSVLDMEAIQKYILKIQ